MKSAILVAALALYPLVAQAADFTVQWNGGGSLVCPDVVGLTVVPNADGGGVVSLTLGGHPYYRSLDRLFVDGAEARVWEWHIYSSAGDDAEVALCTLARNDVNGVVLKCATQ